MGVTMHIPLGGAPHNNSLHTANFLAGYIVDADINAAAGIVASKLENIQTGNYSGDNGTNRTMAHGLGIAPTAVIITVTNAANGTILTMTFNCANWVNSGNGNVRAVTAADATNFYVGDGTNHAESANDNTLTYKWTAVA